MLSEQLIKVKSSDGESIALWKISSEQSYLDKNIFLTHGTFSDKRVCLGLASFLIEKGFTCWIMEWRDHGSSSKPKQKFNFETIATFDLPAVFEHLMERENIKTLNCITHSGGGICLTMFLINNQEYISKIDTISMFGCQAFGAAHSSKNYFKLLLGKYASFILGCLPAQKIGRPHNESYFTMKQWFDWNLSKSFTGENGFDYLKNMKSIGIPVLSVCAKGDTFVAPKEGCALFLNAFQNPKNKLLFCAKVNGFLEDYNHSRILHSRSAEKEIWPVVLDWILP